MPLLSLPTSRLDFVIENKSFPSPILLWQPKQIEVLGG